MITIQGFAKLCGCNTQTLRYYDRIGLLTPAKVDEWTGYRYYEEEQAMLFVKIKNLQQADFTIEEIKALLPGNDDLLMAAFERKIEEQQQKLERIREIQRSYLKETMDMQKLVSTIIVFVDEHLNNPVLWEEFGADMDRRTEITAKAHAILADMLAKNRETLETVTLTMDDQAVSGAENVIRAIQEGNLDSAGRILVNPDGTEEPDGVPEDAAVIFERHGWSHISEWIREMPLLKEAGERYCVFELTAESAANDVDLPMMMLVMMASEMDELKGGVTCNTIPSRTARIISDCCIKKQELHPEERRGGIMEYGNVREIFPGIGCAWTEAGGKATAEYYGVANLESNTPVNSETIFPACSISKFITAICVMKLHEQGVIDIDRPVNHYLQQWKLRTLDGSESNVSIRSVLCHTAGIIDGEDGFYGLRRNDPEISLVDILEGKTAYNSRPVRAEKPQGEAFEYSDAGYCVLQQMLQEMMQKPFDKIARDILFDPLGLHSTFFATPGNMACFENRMATGYDEEGLPIPGRFPAVPDLAASGLWSTPEELLIIAREFMKAYDGRSGFLKQKTVREMVKPAEKFSWTGLGLFIGDHDTLISQGWGENGQCILKMHCRTGEIGAVMTNRNPGVDQQASGVKRLADRYFCEGEQVSFGNPDDIESWMNLVRHVSWNFPGLETEKALDEHRQTVLKFMGKKQALCTKNDEEITGVLLFSRNRNMICCLAVSPEYRREGIASKLLEKALDELDRNRDITVSTFREGDEKGVAPRSLYRKFGFCEGELTVEFDYPNQVFVLKGNGSIPSA